MLRQYVEPPSGPSRRAWRIRQLIRTCLLATMDDDPEDLLPESFRGITGVHRDALLLLAEFMVENFMPSHDDTIEGLGKLAEKDDPELFEDRVLTPVPSMGVAFATHPHFRYMVLAGPRGSGKTTIARTIEFAINGELESGDDDSETETYFLRDYPDSVPELRSYYLDVTDHDARIKAGPDPAVMHPICEVLHETILERILEVDGESELSDERRERIRSFERDLEEFQLSSGMTVDCTAYARAVEAVLGVVDAKNPNARKEAVASSERLQEKREAARDSFHRLRGDHKLSVLLQFLESLGHNCHMIIDNIDRYSSRLQVNVDEVVLDKANTHKNAHFVVPLRNANRGNLTTTAHERPREEVLVMGPRTTGGEPHGVPEGSDEEGEVDEEQAARNAAAKLMVYTAITVRRLRMLQRAIEETELGAYVEEHVLPELNLLNYDSVDHFVRELIRAVLGQDLRFRPLLRPTGNEILQWHNYSIRGSLAQLADLIALTMHGQDQFFRRPRGSSRRFHPRDFQTMCYRQMVFAETPGGRAGFPLVQVFKEDMLPKGAVRFPRLRMLQLLSSHGGKMPWGSMRHWFEQEGYPEDVLLGYLVELSSGRGWESEGLLRVDGILDLQKWHNSPEANEGLSGSRPVRLRSSGRLFMRSVIPSVEYLFWHALEEDRLPHVLSASGDISEAMVLDESYRVKVALSFIRAKLNPAAKKELQIHGVSGKKKEKRARRRRELFEKDLAPAELGSDFRFVLSALANIETFIEEAEPSYSDADELLSQVQALRAIALQI